MRRKHLFLLRNLPMIEGSCERTFIQKSDFISFVSEEMKKDLNEL